MNTKTEAERRWNMLRDKMPSVMMGDAPTYEAARDAAVAEIQRLVDRRVAVL